MTDRLTVASRADSSGAANSAPDFVCPEGCGALLQESESLVCIHGHAFRVERGIPRFVPQEGNYAAAFGMQWKVFRRTQLDSHSGLPVTRERFDRCAGDMVLSRLHAGEGACHVLEVGCGAGRFTEVLLNKGVHVTSVDLSDAVDANAENFPISSKHRIAQADVRSLPFAPKSFDVVVCLGVLQHTPNPEESIAALYSQVRPGGFLVIDHYRPRPFDSVSLKPLWRKAFLSFDRKVALERVETVVDSLLPLHRMFARVPIARSILGRISPVHHFYGRLPLSAQLQREWSVLDTHDALTDYYKHLRTVPQIRAALTLLGLTDIWCVEGGNGVEARGRRPEVS